MITMLLTLALGFSQPTQDDQLAHVVETLIASAEDESATVRAAALQALAMIESDHAGILPAIATGFRDSDPDVRSAAVQSFRLLPGNEDEKTGYLLTLLHDDDLELREIAFMELRNRRESALEPLIRTLNSNMLGEESRREIFYLLQGWEADAAPAVAAIGQVYRDREGFQTIALETLAAIGPAAAEGIPLILEATSHKDEAVRLEAVSALARIAGNPERLATANQAADPRSRTVASQLLSRYDKNGNRVIDGAELDDMPGTERFDRNRDGRITAREIEQMYDSMRRERERER